jgi:preprotein translocase subunit SecD
LGDLRFTVEDVRAGLSGDGEDMRQISIVMNETAAQAFQLFSTTHTNQNVNMFVCGEQVLSATMQAPVVDGFALTGPIEIDRASQMVAALNGEDQCP